MDASEKTAVGDEKPTGDGAQCDNHSERWRYFSEEAEAHVNTTQGLIGVDAGVWDADGKVELFELNGRETVNVNIIIGDDYADGESISTGVELTPEQAEGLARDLFEHAAGARENREGDHD